MSLWTSKPEDWEKDPEMIRVRETLKNFYSEIDALRKIAEAASCLQMQINMESDFFIPLIKALAEWRRLTGKGENDE